MNRNTEYGGEMRQMGLIETLHIKTAKKGKPTK